MASIVAPTPYPLPITRIRGDRFPGFRFRPGLVIDGVPVDLSTCEILMQWRQTADGPVQHEVRTGAGISLVTIDGEAWAEVAPHLLGLDTGTYLHAVRIYPPDDLPVTVIQDTTTIIADVARREP